MLGTSLLLGPTLTSQLSNDVLLGEEVETTTRGDVFDHLIRDADVSEAFFWQTDGTVPSSSQFSAPTHGDASSSALFGSLLEGELYGDTGPMSIQ